MSLPHGQRQQPVGSNEEGTCHRISSKHGTFQQEMWWFIHEKTWYLRMTNDGFWRMKHDGFQEEWWVSHPKTGMCVRFHGRRYSKSRKTRPKTMTGQLQQFKGILLIYCWYSVLIYVNNLIKSQVAKLCKKISPLATPKNQRLAAVPSWGTKHDIAIIAMQWMEPSMIATLW